MEQVAARNRNSGLRFLFIEQVVGFRKGIKKIHSRIYKAEMMISSETSSGERPSVSIVTWAVFS